MIPTKSTVIVYSPKLHIMRRAVYHKFHNDLGIRFPFEQRDGWYKVFQDDNGDWWLYLKPGFQWNGADMFPDYEYMLYPSAVHDVCLWLIDWAVIPEAMNNTVDKELADCIIHSVTPMPWFKGGSSKTLRKVEAWKIKRATHIAKTKAGECGTLLFQDRKIEI